MSSALRLVLGCVALTASAAAGSQTGKSPPNELMTKSGGIVCTSPLRIKEAYKAAVAGDERWLQELGCTSVRDGVPVTVVERTRDYWQVRIRPPGRDGITVWAAPLSFRTVEGTPIDAWGLIPEAKR